MAIFLFSSCSQPTYPGGGESSKPLTGKVLLPNPSSGGKHAATLNVTLPVDNGTSDTATMRILMGDHQQYYQDIFVPALGSYDYTIGDTMTGLSVYGQSISENTTTTITLPNSDRVKIWWGPVNGNIQVTISGGG